MKRTLSITLILILIFSGIGYAQNNDNGENTITATIQSSLLGDYETGDIIFEKNADAKLEVASITKLMTYLVAMDEISKGNKSLKDEVTISKRAASLKGSSFKLKEGEKIKVSTLLESIMIVSANDSCIAIAEYISGSEEKFLKLMNDKAEELGLKKTHFVTVNGYPREDKAENTMSPRDIFKLSRHILKKYPQIIDITSKDKLVIPEREFEHINTNPLMGVVSGVDGLKTGYTDRAGLCLVSTLEVKKDKKNPYRLIGITMGSKTEEERKIRGTKLLNEGIKNYSKKQILNKNTFIKKVNIPNSRDEVNELYPKENVYGLVGNHDTVKKEVIINEGLEAPIKKGDIIGKAILRYGNVKKEIPLTVNEDVKKTNILSRFFTSVKNFISL
ncbi:serine-type D-alanyl-D-alanine carboxypeptidase DacF [Gottschalkia purinilytica]|uniref:serine-type D-Ala-D-Ala carboxypeptidase n=1 Tax=Gottschalkia purinilytica TaxID=1503 RepID=A0A0L0W812_GOTPU|nr:D-alanyl-D-alanine carboxypeptidase family protein [Gottschalkia purinilytica]KNF07577.1 serine-type D-alanyl-D-alanine carboxypeptidase DacF [Gottschalkia purinilytica]